MVFKRLVESDITEVKAAKIAVYTCAFDILQTETKVTFFCDVMCCDVVCVHIRHSQFRAS